MDKRTTIGAVCLTVALIMGWLWLKSYNERTYGPPPQQQTASPQPAPAPAPSTGPASTQPGSTTGPSGSPNNSTGFTIAPTTRPTSAITLGSTVPNDPTYSLALTVSPRGASIGEVVLNQFKHPADFKKPEKDKRLYSFQKGNEEVPNYQPLSSKWIRINGTTTLWLENVEWTLESTDATSAIYSLTINRDGTPALKITKTWKIHPQTDETKGYEVAATTLFQNLTGDNLTVRSGFDGPTLPPRELSRPPDRQVVGGYRNDVDRAIEIVPHAVEEFSVEKQHVDVTRSKEGRPLGWVGTATVYFVALVEGGTPSGPKAPTEVFSRVVATMHQVDHKEILPEDRPLTMAFETVDVPLEPNAAVVMPINVYLGPRWREVLETPVYSQYPRQFNEILVIKTGPCSVCTFTWLIDGLVSLLKGFYFLCGGFLGAGKGDWGLAIILLVCLVRTLLHPILKRSQIQMMKMGKLGPEIEKLKAKYGDDKEGLNKAMMSFYKENGAGQILGCLPMFLQMPIWIALYSALQTTFQLRQAQFLWGYTWIKDLAKPDYLIQFDRPFTAFFGWIHLDGLNILPILLGVVFWLNHKYTPKPPPANKDQEMQQKMMQWMVLLFPVFLYSGPSGLNLYIFTSTAIGIIESKIIRKHIKEKEEAEKLAGPAVVVDAPATRAAKKNARQKDEPPVKQGGLTGWWADMQAKVEQARQQADKKK